MFEKVVTSKTKQNLALLGKSAFIKDFYLAGGTALALQIGHRSSIDLDFFSNKEFRPELISARLRKLGSFSLKSQAVGTLHGIFNGTRVTFLYYPYPLLLTKKSYLNVRLADYLDIACMKLDVVSRRGYKKDFIDLYAICQNVDLKELLKLFEKKYKGINFNIIHIFKSLSYFEQAEKQPMPKMYWKISWKEVKKFFLRQTKEFVKEFL